MLKHILKPADAMRAVARLGFFINLISGIAVVSYSQEHFWDPGKQQFFDQVTPGRIFSFPEDHRIHEDFLTEWWYITANLAGADGLAYGVQFTLFRNVLLVAGERHPVFFAHAALSTQTEFYYAERFARAAMGHGGVESDPWLAFLDHWQLEGTGPNPLPGRLSVKEEDFGYELSLSVSPYFLQGESGFSKKNTDGSIASYYYNAPFIRVEGEIQFNGRSVYVKGDAWLDREWSSTPLTDGALGWDWLALHLNAHTAVMLYRVRSKGEDYLTGTLMSDTGRQHQLDAAEIDWQPLEWAVFDGAKYPVIWRLSIPSEGIRLTVAPINRRQFLQTTTQYWEGAVQASGSHSADGYLELFGY